MTGTHCGHTTGVSCGKYLGEFKINITYKFNDGKKLIMRLSSHSLSISRNISRKGLLKIDSSLTNSNTIH